MSLNKIVYQDNVGGIVALLPTGKVAYFHPSVKPYIEQFNRGDMPKDMAFFEDFILESPFVALDNFHLSAPALPALLCLVGEKAGQRTFHRKN
ncbi:MULTISPECIES: hypothetical protein [Photorhabdus]|uniref:hypothetical protein n=1 Tax=Photorhabdus TaxID=29487 RepID=UPI000A6C4A80|nr:hypothetical protein [Photorhabdus thracensis]